MNRKQKKANVINENEATKTSYDNEMYRPTIDVDVKTKPDNENKKNSSNPNN